VKRGTIASMSVRRTFNAGAVEFWVDEKLNFKALAMLGQDTHCLVDEHANVTYERHSRSS
jgi:hypothetical protein